MTALTRCHFCRTRFVKISFIVLISITLLNIYYFTNSFHKTAIISSIKADEKDQTNNQADDIKALIQLKSLQASKLSLRSDDIIHLEQFTRKKLTQRSFVVKESYNNDKANSDVSKGVRNQATQPIEKNYHKKYKTEERENPINHKTTNHCPNNALGHKSSLVSYGKCKPHQASSQDCKEAHRLYYLDPPKCKDQYKGEICSLNVTIKNDMKALKAHCNRKICREGRHSIVVKRLNPANGQHDIVHKYNSIRKLEQSLPLIMEHSRRKEYHYVFIECEGRTDGSKVLQLLPLDPRLTIKENHNRQRHNVLNVNIILLDSVSRAHFYRSLPKTINIFKRWTNHRAHSPALVLDFELFQAVEGHTAENTHALFTGKLFPKSINRDSPPSVGMEKLFGHYKRADYQTSWQEDLCWEGQWGLFVDLSIPFNWKNLQPTLKKVSIDNTGLTHSSCEVLKTYNLITPFNGPPGHAICYNGKFQHSYFLKYNQEMLQAIAFNPKALPLVSYMTLSVGHDPYGRRIQSFDEELSQFVKQMAQDTSTITILLADHGNTYTQYTTTTQEGRFEMFHPSLFIIIPNEVSKRIGKDAIYSLTTNQRRLVTMVDLHQSLMAIAGPIPATGIPLKGLFTPIPLNRTCESVELRTPNLCVCEGWDSPTTNDTLKLAIVEFAVGQLNNRLQEWFIETKRELPLTRSCNRLQPVGFSNVRQRNTDTGSLITSFDIMVPAGDVVKHKQDLFRVEVKTNVSPLSTSLDMELVHYERLSMFGLYRVCADNDINIKLCVCSNRKHKTQRITRKKLERLMVKKTSYFVDSKVKFSSIDEEGCLTLIERVHGKGDVYAYELANTCLDQSYTVVLEMTDMYNIRVSCDGPIETKVAPGSVRFVFSARKNLSYYDGHISVQVTSIE